MTGSRGGGGQQNRQEGDRWLAVPRTEAEAELRQALDRAAGREADEVALRRVWARISDPETLMPALGDPSKGGDASDGGDGSFTRRPRWPWIVAASLAGATVALAFMLIETKSEVRFSVVRKAAPVMAPSVTGAGAGASGSREAPDLRSVVVAPATVRTGAGETLHLTLRGGTEVAVKSQSALVLDENDRPSVSAGEVHFHVPSQAPGRTFAVTIGAYRVVVVGTRFHVRVNQVNTVVGVDEGIVEIWSDHRVARIGAGESWASPAVSAAQVPETESPPVSPPSEAHVAVPSFHGAAGKTIHGARLARASRAKAASMLAKAEKAQTISAPATASAPADKPVAKETHRALALASPSSSPAQIVAPLAIAAPVPVKAATAVGNASSGEGTAATVPDIGAGLAPAAATAPVDSAAPLVVQARQARSLGDFRRALEIYRALAQRSGAAGENAEYEIGRILRDGLHQPREALAAWRLYRVHHPRGSLRMEADISVIETLVSLGDKAGALAESSEFIGRYPESERRLEVARLSGDLSRERGDCPSAVTAYDVAMGTGRSRKDGGNDIADGVSFHRSTCLLRSNHKEGVAALKTYLQSFPWGRFRGEAQRLLTDAQPAAPAAAHP